MAVVLHFLSILIFKPTMVTGVRQHMQSEGHCTGRDTDAGGVRLILVVQPHDGRADVGFG
jgi:hypothetical protein